MIRFRSFSFHWNKYNKKYWKKNLKKQLRNSCASCFFEISLRRLPERKPLEGNLFLEACAMLKIDQEE